MDKISETQTPVKAPDLKPNILIVDDVPENLEVLSQLLMSQGYEPRPVPGGKLALSAAKADPPDLIILDINMPEMDGFDVCKHLKADVELKDIPVIFLTSFTETEDKVKAFSMGGVDYITKPFRVEEMCVRLETHLRLRRLQREVEKYSNHLENLVQDKTKEIQFLATAIEQTGEAMCITNLEGVIQYVNPAFERVCGYTREEAIGKTPRIIYSGIHDKDFYLKLWETISGGNTWEGQIVNKRKDGTLYTEAAIISPIRDKSGQIVNYVSVKRDITSHLRLQAMLNQAQKMEALGQLSGGVAHDFKNLLSIINGYSQMLVSNPDLKASVREQIQEILHAGESALSLTRQLLAFSRRQVIKAQSVDLNRIVSDINRMLRRLVRENIIIAMETNPELWRINADPGQLEQLMINLIVNARDAMPGGGKITVKTENVNLDGESISAHSVAGMIPGSYVKLSVSDTGCGMDEKTREHIFEPFFTTKAEGKGTGLGLSTVYGIVKQSKGYIDVQSEAGKGATFNIYLPRYMGKKEQALAEDSEKRSLHGHETILLVEDVSMLLGMIVNILENFGYLVLPAKTWSEAIILASEHAGEIQLLLTDAVMPEVNGLELYRKLMPVYPNIKCIFISGHADDILIQNGIKADSANLIRKPFSTKILLDKVREVLDS